MIPERPEEAKAGCASIGPRDTLIRGVFATFHRDIFAGQTRFFVRRGVKENLAARGNLPEEILNFVLCHGTHQRHQLLLSGMALARSEILVSSESRDYYRLSIRPIDRSSEEEMLNPPRPALQHRRKPYFTIPPGIYRFVLARLFARRCAPFSLHIPQMRRLRHVALPSLFFD